MAKRPTRPADPPYDVGYGKPPKATQFKKGESGNPAGRPRRRCIAVQDLSVALREALSTKVTVVEGGKRQSLSKMDVALRQLVNKAAAGEPRATHQVLQSLQQIERRPQLDAVADEATDRAHMEAIRRRMAAVQATRSASPPARKLQENEGADEPQ